MANQNWNSSAYFSYHINAFVESRDPEERGSLFAQIGLHNRGSSVGFTSLNNIRNRRAYKFQNISLLVGAKKPIEKYLLGGTPYYFVGIRGEYTLSENLREMQEDFVKLQSTSINPEVFSTFLVREPANVEKFLYGISLGGGLQFDGGEYFNTALEFTLSPDLSYQYIGLPQGSSGSVRQVRNVSFEVSLVLRFLREVIYE